MVERIDPIQTLLNILCHSYNPIAHAHANFKLIDMMIELCIRQDYNCGLFQLLLGICQRIQHVEPITAQLYH